MATRITRPANLRENLPGLWRISRYFWPHARKYKGLMAASLLALFAEVGFRLMEPWPLKFVFDRILGGGGRQRLTFLPRIEGMDPRSEEHTSELQSHSDLVCRLLLEKKNPQRAAHEARTLTSRPPLALRA